MKNKIHKILPVPVVESRDALFNHDLEVRIRLSELDIWSEVHKSCITQGRLHLQVLRENDDYFDVVVPGEILCGSRIVRINKTGSIKWFYQITP